MSYCIHCSAHRVHMRDNFCFESQLYVDETMHSLIFAYKKIPDTTLNSDADTPTWCPRGLK
jgi:hypothetical protein